MTTRSVVPIAVLVALACLAHASQAAPTIQQNKPRPHLFYRPVEIADFAGRVTTAPELSWYATQVTPDVQAALGFGIYTGSNRTTLRLYFERMDEIGLAALVDQDPGLRQQALDLGRNVLLSAAANYGAMQLTQFWGPTTAPSAIALAALYDSIHPQLSGSDRNAIEGNLLERILDDYPGSPQFNEMANKGVISHSTLGIVALAIEDQVRFDRAYGTDPDNEPSFLWGITVGYGGDGIWTEPSQHYQQFTMDHVLAFAIATFHATESGVAEVFETTPTLRQIHAAHVEVAYPSLYIVPTGDSKWLRPVMLDHAEVLNKYYPGSDDLDYTLDIAYGPMGFPRGQTLSAWRLVHYVDHGNAGSYRPVSAVHAEDGSGFGVLRHGTGADQLHAFIDFAAPQPNHDHLDKLAIYLAGFRRIPVTSVVKADRAGFGHTVFQNTVVVDERSQSRKEGQVQALESSFGSKLQLLAATANTAYGIAYERLLVMFKDEYVLDLFTVAGAGSHTYDWVQHRLDEPVFTGVGTFGAAGLGGGDGYDRLTGVESAPAVGSAIGATSASATHGGIRTLLLREPGDTVFRANAPGPENVAEHPMFFVRREGGSETQFACVHALASADTFAVSSIAGMPGTGGAGDSTYGATIQTTLYADDVILDRYAPGGGIRTIGAYATDARAGLVRRQGATIHSVFLLNGTVLADEDSTLVDTFGSVASVESDGDTVDMAGDVTEFMIYAPAAIHVRIGGQPVAFAKVGDYVVSGEENLPPVADAGGPYAGLPDEVIVFDGTGSFDPEGASLAYSWEFGDGATGEGPAPSHQYADPGEYEARLVVHDGQLPSAPAVASVTITGTAAAGDGHAAPLTTRLLPAAPNPLVVSARIRFELAAPGRVRLGIYGVSGRLVKLLIDGHRAPGRYERLWNGLTDGGAPVPSGLYFYRLQTPAFSEARRLLVVR